ncbi:MAG: DsbA family protein [Candidatus Paceibacteria bacterium]
MNNRYKVLIFIFVLALFTPTLTDANKNSGQACSLETRTAVKAKGSDSVYYITKDCTKRAFENSKVFFSYFRSWSEVREVPVYKLNSVKKDELGFMPWGPKKDFKSGALVKTVNDPKVYVLLGNKKCWLKNQTVFNQLNYNFDWIVDVDPRVLDKYKSCSKPISYTDHHPPGTLIKYPDSNNVYILKKQDGQIKKKLIENEQEFNKLGYRWDRILTVSKEETYLDYSTEKNDLKNPDQTGSNVDTDPLENNTAIDLESVTEEDWQRGAKKPKITLVGYTDLEGPFSKRFHGTIKRVMETYEGEIQWVYRHAPLEKLNPQAPKEARAAECVGHIGGEDKFWAFVDKIFKVTPSEGELDLSKLPQYASEAGISKTEFKQCYDSGKYKDEVQNDLESAKRAGLRGTPYSILVGPDGNKKKISGARPYSIVVKKIEELLSK